MQCRRGAQANGPPLSHRGRSSRSVTWAAAFARTSIVIWTLRCLRPEAVDAAAKDLATKQLGKLAARKAAKKAANTVAPAMVKPKPPPASPPETPEQLRARVRAALLRRSA